MKASRHTIAAAALACGILAWSAARAESGNYPLAGSTPERRPDAAPRIATALVPDRRLALHGIAQPHPSGLKFLDDHGGWYSPFSHPGMTAPYDLRGWHAAPTSPQPTK